MADKAPLASVPMFDVPEIGAPKNPTGIGSNPEITAANEEYLKAAKDYADQLEQRYARPNWFKIAAGFAKPQLGGFTASLGSASQAMGEQAELERAIAPTVAQMRSQLALQRVAQTQGIEAAKIAEKARKEDRITNPLEAAQIAGLTGGPGTETQAGQTSSTAQFGQLLQAIQSGSSYTDLVSRLPKSFVDQYLPIMINMIPGQKPPAGTPSSVLGITQATTPTGAPKAARIPGAPESSVEGLPISQQLTAQSQDLASMQVEREDLNKTLTQQSTTGVPIFEVATNLYKAASSPALAKAFGVFEGGDPLSIIGKSLESGSFPNVIANMRTYITQARMGAEEKKSAMSDLQAMEATLADLKTKMNNGVINPTDAARMFESESIPGTRSTQDAFLRGMARIGSDALTRYETKKAFDAAIKDPNFNVRDWASSDYFKDVQENAKKRAQSVIMNPASREMPKFMQQGLSGAFSAPTGKKESPSGTPNNRPSERVIDGTYWKKEGDNWVNTGRKAP